MATAMQHRTRSDWHDVWRVAGTPVSELDALRPDRFDWQDPTRGFRPGALPFHQHRGHFAWSGSNMHSERVAAGHALARYLSVVHALSPDEPIRIVAHSHGCNVVKVASASEDLHPHVEFETVFLLACPHVLVQASRGPEVPYWLETRRCLRGEIFNLFSEEDSVQMGWAQAYPGPPEDLASLFRQPEMFRTDQSTRYKQFRDFAIETMDEDIAAHSALHGSVVGELIGLHLGSDVDGFWELFEKFERSGFPVPAGDNGE